MFNSATQRFAKVTTESNVNQPYSSTNCLLSTWFLSVTINKSHLEWASSSTHFNGRGSNAILFLKTLTLSNKLSAKVKKGNLYGQSSQSYMCNPSVYCSLFLHVKSRELTTVSTYCEVKRSRQYSMLAHYLLIRSSRYILQIEENQDYY